MSHKNSAITADEAVSSSKPPVKIENDEKLGGYKVCNSARTVTGNSDVPSDHEADMQVGAARSSKFSKKLQNARDEMHFFVDDV